MNSKALGVFAAALTVVGCSQPAQDVSTLNAKIDKLDTEIFSLKSQVATLQEQQRSQGGEIFTLKLKSEAFETATFDPVTSQGYITMDVGVGKLMLSVQDIETYGDGIKVRLDVGNPNAVTLNGLKGQATYGISSSKIGTVPFDEWTKKEKTVPISIPDSLTPARWNHVTITLPGITASEFGHLELTLSANQVQMYR